MQISPDYKFMRSAGFIVLEGVNGAGKSVLQKKIFDFCSKFKSCVNTREPGGSSLGIKLRELLLNQADYPKSHLTELFLFAADRAEHVVSVIKPALANKQVVISDRYYYSTAAFQGYGHELDLTLVNTINTIAIQNTIPDLVILLDLDPKIGLARTKNREKYKDDFESKELKFHDNLRKGFLELAKNLPEPFLVIDASQTEQAVWQAVEPVITNWIKSF